MFLLLLLKTTIAILFSKPLFSHVFPSSDSSSPEFVFCLLLSPCYPLPQASAASIYPYMLPTNNIEGCPNSAEFWWVQNKLSQLFRELPDKSKPTTAILREQDPYFFAIYQPAVPGIRDAIHPHGCLWSGGWTW